MKKLVFALSFAVVLLLIAINVLILRLQPKDPATLSISTELFQKKLHSPCPEWISHQIDRDLMRYRSTGISRQMLEDNFYSNAQRYNLVRFHIKDKQLTFSLDGQKLKSRHFKKVLAAIEKLNECADLPDVDFILSLEDGFDNDPSLPICPWFVFAKHKANDRYLLIPDFAALAGYAKIRDQIAVGKKAHPWKKKVAKAFWRGSTTGGSLTRSNWKQIPRSKLVLLSLQYPHLLDARFHHIVQCTPEIPKLMQQQGMVSKSVKKADHLKYKYLVDIDGNSCSFERLFWLLLSNSLVLKQQSPNIQWYYSALKPYEHYIPLKEDLSDLVEKIHWGKTHDEEAQIIVQRASQFVEENLSNEDICLYLYHLLKAYARLYRG